MSIAEKLHTIAENEQRVYDAGKARGVEEGKQDEYIRFWETHLANIYDGMYAFCGWGWNDETFNPPRGTVLRPTYAHSMFAHTGITDFVTLCEEKDITLDFSRSTTTTQLFYAPSNGRVLRIGVVDTTNSNSLNQTFRGQGKLHTIVLLKLKDNGSQSHNTTFTGCKALVYLRIEGTIGQNGFDVSPCPLDHDSLMSIIDHLKSGVSGLTVTLGSANLAKLTDAEKAIATQKGWTLL